ncbi:hypothetical protein VI06_04975 [Aquitalea magnusonii]|nr:hypothetical protein VI06_04975 [Aquitalea magnusonii]
MSQQLGKVDSITNYKELLTMLANEEESLKLKVKETYWLRYVFRRIPLFAGVGLIFFGVCFAMAMTKEIGFEAVDKFLKSLLLFDKGCRDYILIVSLALLLARALLPWYFFDRKSINDSNKKKIWNKFLDKPVTNFLLSGVLLSGFSTILASKYPLQFGIAVFSVVTVSSILIDRVLGFTRRNERYQLFCSKALGLQILFRSREKLKIIFSQSHLLECSQFYEELRQSKHNDTVADSFYILSQIEQLKQLKLSK